MNAFSYVDWLKDLAEDLAGELCVEPIVSSGCVLGAFDSRDLIEVFCHPEDVDVTFIKDFKYLYRGL